MFDHIKFILKDKNLSDNEINEVCNLIEDLLEQEISKYTKNILNTDLNFGDID